MKNYELQFLASFVGGIKIGSVSNKETRAIITRNHLALYRKAKAIGEDLDELRKKYFDGKDEEIKAYNEHLAKIAKETNEKARKALESAVNKEMADLIKSYNESVNDLHNQECECSLEALSIEAFGELVADAEVSVITPDGKTQPVTLADYPFFQECGLIKEAE